MGSPEELQSYENDAYIEEEYQDVLDSYSEEMYDDDDTTGDSVEVLKEAVDNLEEQPVYDYSDITDSEEEEPVSKKTTREPTSRHMDVTIRKQFVDVDEKKRKLDADTNTIQKQFMDMEGEIKGKANSGQSSRVSCLLLILALTVHWMFVRFSTSRRLRPRRVIQIRRRPAHLH